MLIVVGIMLAGIGIGYLFRRRKLSGIQPLIMGLIWLLLFLLGLEVGSNDTLIRSLHSLGLEAVALAAASVIGSTLFAWALWVWISQKRKEDRP